MNTDHSKDIDSLFAVINHLSELMESSQNDFRHFLKKLIVIIQNIIPVDSCFIYFYDRGGKQLILEGSKKSHSKQLGKITLSESEGITGWVATHQKTVAIEKQAYKDKRFKMIKELPEDLYESFLSVPIMNETGVAGVINLQNKKPYKFSEKEIKTVELIVKIISSAFVKIALDRRVDHLENKLEERKIVEKAKGVLMKIKNLSEEEAYRFLQKEAMHKRKNMKEIAEAVLLVY